MIGIYKITSPSGRIYIGQSIDIEDRWSDYFNLQNCNRQPRLYRSFLKYNVKNHIFEKIEECEENKLNNRERYWQDYYNVTGKNGMNCRLQKSDDKSGRLSEITKKKLSDYHIELRLNGGGNPPPLPRSGERNGMYNKKHSIETISKMKLNRKLLLGEDHYNSSIFLDPETGIFYFSVREVANVLNKTYNYVADRIYGKIKNNNLTIIKV